MSDAFRRRPWTLAQAMRLPHPPARPSRLDAHSGFAENRHALVADPVARLVLQPLRLRLDDEPARSDAVATAPCAPADQAGPGPDDRDVSEHFWVGNDL